MNNRIIFTIMKKMDKNVYDTLDTLLMYDDYYGDDYLHSYKMNRYDDGISICLDDYNDDKLKGYFFINNHDIGIAYRDGDDIVLKYGDVVRTFHKN